MPKLSRMSELDYGLLKAVKLDDEFRDLVPLPAGEESDKRFQEGLEAGISPVILWQWQCQLILLIGYQIWPALLKRGKSFPAIIKQFSNRGEARLFIIQHHLRQRTVSRLMLSYVRGQRCRPEKLPPGRPAAISPTAGAKFGKRLTMEDLAEQYGVTRETLRLDEKFAHAVDRLLEVLEKERDIPAKKRQEAKRLLLGQGVKITRDRVDQLANEPPKEQVKALRGLLFDGRLPSPAKESKRDFVGVRLPVGCPEEQAKILIEKLGREAATELSRMVLANLAAPAPEDEVVL